MRYFEYCINFEKQLIKVLDCRVSGYFVNDILQVKILKFNEKFEVFLNNYKVLIIFFFKKV